ncbi:hypothetical protein JGUZn3_22180 [Entomobacter blattae]|uniref:Uncharacterized protein n=2 Tax=Entomobacter blattae TaxID=2762277 RepID=A0A7H1NUF9_9PROT|nr:hypothetical protein JGUZn3_22180 [Entomobacter blattae]
MARGDVVTYGKNHFAVVWKIVGQKTYLLPIILLPPYRHRADVPMRKNAMVHILFIDAVVRCREILARSQENFTSTDLCLPDSFMKLCDLALKREADIQVFEKAFEGNHKKSLPYFLKHLKDVTG